MELTCQVNGTPPVYQNKQKISPISERTASKVFLAALGEQPTDTKAETYSYLE